MAKYLLFISLIFTISCKTAQLPAWQPYDESAELAKSNSNENIRMRYKLIQSKLLDKNAVLKIIYGQLVGFSEKDYQELKPLILEQDIPTMQSHVRSGALTYQKLTQWYLYRIAKFESDKATMLNNIIAINPMAVSEARKKDKQKNPGNDLIYGMPVLLKDNIDVKGLTTTAGAHALMENRPGNAFITDRLQEKGAIILGKTNLSEWANYLCLVCPNGYSAVGGQTLNPYGRMLFDTGGSSSGSGSAIAANYAAAAVGTETSGSILSPSSSNSLAGLKPTTGLLSRSGIVPISSTFDTPGPMTRNITDNAIMLAAMSGEDSSDPATKNNPKGVDYLNGLKSASLKGLRLGAYRTFLRDSIYKLSVEKMRALGAVIVEIDAEQVSNNGFGVLLDADMKADLPAYIKNHASANIKFQSVTDIMAFNRKDSSVSIPYGQGRLEGVVRSDKSTDSISIIKATVRKIGVSYFEKQMAPNQLDAIVSIANRSAGFAAAANYPCLTLPMGYRPTGEPAGITFIARPFMEAALLRIGYTFEQASKARRLPEGYE